ncbi:unnamed protein product [Cylindrotheca closterium]|uniref:Uncharacterized protein n=1 Tax=Cylindrotheca closterium TaxID=2856 RepID=A0AAD2JHQ5_9STRA|nr:unnamed protein product [Cylindrotheca closterium]
MQSYHFRGNEGEQVPDNVPTIIVDDHVEVLPEYCCRDLRLREVQLNEGLKVIRTGSFSGSKLAGVRIPSTTETIEEHAFNACKQLTEVAFAEPSSLERLKEAVFMSCPGLERIKLPPSVKWIERLVFCSCDALVQVDLSLSNIRDIPSTSFAYSRALQAVRLPTCVARIASQAFANCIHLVTVEMAPTYSVRIEQDSFLGCASLANILFPQGVIEKGILGVVFADKCTTLHKCCGPTIDELVQDLIHRFDGHPFHRLCYHSSTTTVDELRDTPLENDDDDDAPAVDKFGMTPFHILCSSVDPRQDLFLVLLDKFPHYSVLGLKDANGKRAMDYLVANWTLETKVLFQEAMRRWTIDSLEHWGAPAGVMQDMERRVEAICTATRKDRRVNLYKEACSQIERYARNENMTVLELSLWKQKIVETGHGREECRFLCHADIVLSNIGAFLGLVKSSS